MTLYNPKDYLKNQKSAYVYLTTSTLKGSPCTKIKVGLDERIYEKICQHLQENMHREEEGHYIRNRAFSYRFKDITLNLVNYCRNKGELKEAYYTPKDLGFAENGVIHVQAELSHDDFYNHYHVLRFETKTEKDVKNLEKWISNLREKGEHVDVWSHPVVNSFSDIKLRKSASIAGCGVKPSVHIPNIKKHIQDSQVSDPSNGFHGQFHKAHEINRYLHFISSDLQKIPKVFSRIDKLGTTNEGYDMLSLVVSRENSKLPERSKVALVSGFHAREWSSVATLMYIADCLRNTSDEEMQNLLKNSELHIIPMVNPEGYDYSFTEGNRFWRTNKNGVDINRNFPSHFKNPGLYSNYSEVYPGPYPLSEVESKLLVNYFEENGPFLGVIDFHCYKKLFCFPYGFSGERPDNYEDMLKCGEVTTNAIKLVNNTKYQFGQIYYKIYKCNGTFLDWVLSSGLAKFAFVNEIDGKGTSDKSSFVSKPSDIMCFGMENHNGVKAFMGFVLKHCPHLQKASSLKSPVSLLSSETKREMPERLSKVNCARSVLQCFGSLGNVKNWLQLKAEKQNEFAKIFGDTVIGLSREKNQRPDMIKKFLEEHFKENKMEEKVYENNGSKFAIKCADKLVRETMGERLFNGEAMEIVSNDASKKKFYEITVPLAKPTFIGCLSDYFSGKSRDMITFIDKYPACLLITLSRLDDDFEGKNKVVALEKTLDLGSFSVQKPSHPVVYEVKSLLNFYIGNPGPDRYTATVKNQDNNYSEIEGNVVLNSKCWPDTIKLNTRNVCMLFLEKKCSESTNNAY